jgi:hypothetical protein
VWKKAIFNETGTRFTQNVTIADADYLEIKNEGPNIVAISGDIEKIGNITQTLNPYLGLGTLAAASGLILMVYGIWTKPKKKRFERKSRTSPL